MDACCREAQPSRCSRPSLARGGDPRVGLGRVAPQEGRCARLPMPASCGCKGGSVKQFTLTAHMGNEAQSELEASMYDVGRKAKLSFGHLNSML
jgi:hypothetical protein